MKNTFKKDKVKILLNKGILIFCSMIFSIILLSGCSNQKYSLKWGTETQTYNTSGSLIGVTVNVDFTNKSIKGIRDIHYITIPSTKLLHNEYSDRQGQTLITNYYGIIYDVRINLFDNEYPNEYKTPDFEIQQDICKITIKSGLDEKFTLTIIYTLDASLTKTFDLTTYEWK